MIQDSTEGTAPASTPADHGSIDTTSGPEATESATDATSNEGKHAPDDYESMFDGRSFGGEFVWAEAPGYVAKILHVRAGKNVPVSTQNRRDMKIMLTGGRAVLEIEQNGEQNRVELMPGQPQEILHDIRYRLSALTEVELFTIFTTIDSQ